MAVEPSVAVDSAVLSSCIWKRRFHRNALQTINMRLRMSLVLVSDARS